MVIRVGLLCLVCTLLSACGGGGGGDDGGGRSNTPPPSTFALTEANAVQAAAYALAPLELMFPLGALPIRGAQELSAYGGRQRTFSYCSATSPASPIDAIHNDRDGSGTVSVGDVIDVVTTAACTVFPRRLTLTVGEVELTSTVQRVSGRVEFDAPADPPGMGLVGSMVFSLDFSPATSVLTWRIRDAAVTVTHNNTTQTFRAASSELMLTPTSYSFAVAGGSVDSGHLGGSYTFATTAPFLANARRLPHSGELMLNTSSGTRARVAPPPTPGSNEATVEYAVAASSSGPFAPTQQTLWTTIIRGFLFGWQPNQAPTLTNLRIQPPNPPPGAGLSVTYNAQDPNGDSLQTAYEWRRNGTIVGTGPALNIATARNDQVSVTVTVSDGRLTATAATTITIGNPPPTLTLTLTPAQPDTTHDLVVVPSVSDPDGDPVTLAYEWRRNGAVIGNRTAATLPASETTRGEAISVRVTASDGVSTVEATASTIILDSPPLVTVLSPPTTVTHGAPVTFTATVADPDGDPLGPLDFVLAYGPAGMTVDPDTGVVDWTAAGPMFDREMSFSWGITVTGQTAHSATGTLKVTDPTRDYPMMRTGMQIPVPAGLSVGDFDGDGDREMLIMGQRWLFEVVSNGAGGYRQSWVYPYALDPLEPQPHYPGRNALATGDVDGDGKHEIFAASGHALTKLDGDERRPVATRRLGATETCADLALADLANDGDEELICLATTDYWLGTARILVLRASDLSLRHEYPSAGYGRALAVGNVDGDAALELITTGGYVFDGATLTNQWFFGSGFGIDVDTGDVDGNGVDEIVAAHDYEAVRVYRSGQPAPIAQAPRSDLDSLRVANVSGDARPEIVVGDGSWGAVTIYGYNIGTSGLDLIDMIPSQGLGVTAIGVGNVDGDSGLELIWGTQSPNTGADTLIVAERSPTLEVEWQNDTQVNGPFSGGQLAGSALEPREPLFLSTVSNNGSSGPRLVRMPRDGGDLETSSAIGSNYSPVNSAPDVVDYDADGEDEVFLAIGNSYYSDPLFRVYDFFGDADVWTSGLIPNQGSAIDVTHADVTGDGRPELIGVTWPGLVYVHNVVQQSLWWQSPTLNEGRRVFAADLDGDPDDQAELVVVGARNVYVFRHAPQPTAYVQAAMYQTNQEIFDADVGDTDGDGEVEIALLLGQPNSYLGAGTDVARLDDNLQSLGSFTLPWPAVSLAIEPSPTSHKNLLIGRMIGPSRNYAHEGTLAIVDARTGSIVFESPPLVGVVQHDSVHYFTPPGETVPRMSIGTSGGMYLTR